MSKKTRKEENTEKKRPSRKEQLYEEASSGLIYYPRVAAVVIAFALLLFLLSWADVYNTDIPGKEVSVSGWSFVMSAITGSFTSADGIYGDMAVPFYYYAADYCQPLAYVTLAAACAAIASLAVQVVSIIGKKHGLNYAAVLLSFVSSVLLIICFCIGLSMSGSDILPIYCSGNPACSIRSFAIIPGVLILIAGVVNLLASLKYFKARKILK